MSVAQQCKRRRKQMRTFGKKPKGGASMQSIAKPKAVKGKK